MSLRVRGEKSLPGSDNTNSRAAGERSQRKKRELETEKERNCDKRDK